MRRKKALKALGYEQNRKIRKEHREMKKIDTITNSRTKIEALYEEACKDYRQKRKEALVAAKKYNDKKIGEAELNVKSEIYEQARIAMDLMAERFLIVCEATARAEAGIIGKKADRELIKVAKHSRRIIPKKSLFSIISNSRKYDHAGNMRELSEYSQELLYEREQLDNDPQYAEGNMDDFINQIYRPVQNRSNSLANEEE